MVCSRPEVLHGQGDRAGRDPRGHPGRVRAATAGQRRRAARRDAVAATHQVASRGAAARVKLGVDPTAPDIHLGHTVVCASYGSSRTSATRPSSSSATTPARWAIPPAARKSRPQLSDEVLAANARTYVDQAAKVLDMDKVELTRNGDWLGPLRMNDVLRLTSHGHRGAHARA